MVCRYIIPGADGSLEAGKVRYNWVWYFPLSSNSPEFIDIMTDTNGVLHKNTLPVGTMKPSAWKPYVSLAQAEMCAPFAEIVSKAAQPFITAISEAAGSRAVAMIGKVVIAGEALSLVKPFLALSTTQSAMQALLLGKVFAGEETLEGWEKKVLKTAKLNGLATNAFGGFWLHGIFNAVKWLVRYLITLVKS